MRWILKLCWSGVFMVLVTCAAAGTSRAATIHAGSCSFEDVSAAVAAATWGDVVVVPEGEADWGEHTLVISKGITLLGAGKDRTIINSAPAVYSSSSTLISFDADETTAKGDYPFKLDGFHLRANGMHPPYSLLRLSNTHFQNHLSNVVISNNRFQQLMGTDDSCMAIALYPAVFGVTHGNEIIDGSHAWRFLGSLNSGKTVIHWQPGSQHAMYFEDNLVRISQAWTTFQLISGGNGNRYVSRYNTFDLSANGPRMFTQTHDIHGNQPNNPGAGIGFEAYGEHRMGGSGRWLDQRGGQVYFFMNQWSQTEGEGSYNVWEEFDDDTFSPSSCQGLSYPTTAGGVNCLQRARDSYYWRCFTGMTGTTLVTTLNILFDHFERNSEPPTVNNPLVLFENLAWWRDNSAPFTGVVAPVGSCGYSEGPSCTASGIGCGTLAEMHSITNCTAGTGFWVTSQGNCDNIGDYVGHTHTRNIQGALYKCNTSNQWEHSYEPFTYPHPLRVGPGQDGGMVQTDTDVSEDNPCTCIQVSMVHGNAPWFLLGLAAVSRGFMQHQRTRRVG